MSVDGDERDKARIVFFAEAFDDAGGVLRSRVFRRGRDFLDDDEIALGIALREFGGEEIPWAHLDIAGPANSHAVEGELVKGGTGFGVRTLVELLSSYTKPKLGGVSA